MYSKPPCNLTTTVIVAIFIRGPRGRGDAGVERRTPHDGVDSGLNILRGMPEADLYDDEGGGYALSHFVI